jgi:tripartite-type tricarboxylate transporter receptor subunit TctC
MTIVSRLACSLLSTAALALGQAAHAADPYPPRAVTLVVPFTPGGTTDIIGRVMAEGLARRLKQTVVVENKGGAGGNLGAAAVAAAAPDGLTLLVGYNGTNAINPSLYRKPGFDPLRSFEPIGMVARVNNAVVVRPTLEVRNLKELAAHARAQPGKLNYGSAGAGSIFHLAGEMFEAETGASMTHIAYKGAAPAMTDLLAGQIDLMFTTIPSALQHIRSQKLRVIGVTGATRSNLFPDIPTTREQGFPNTVVDSWFALFAPKGTPASVIRRLSDELRSVLVDPAVLKRLEEQGATPAYSTPEELERTLQADIAAWKAVIERAKVSLD